MAKFYGVIGFAISSETSPGVWTDQITERNYRGDVLKNYNSWKETDKVNDDYIIDNYLSVISDPFVYQNFEFIKYVIFMGVKWKIRKIEIQRPRILITTGERYHDQT